MNLKALCSRPVWLCALAISMVLGIQELSRRDPQFDPCQRLEWITYDWRMRMANRLPEVATNQLGFVFIDDGTVQILSEGTLGTNVQHGLYWPRDFYGRVLRELRRQGALMVGMDVLFTERRREFDTRIVPLGEPSAEPLTSQALPSDAFFQHQLQRAGNIILGASPEVPPHTEFRTVAAGMGDITIEKDADGVLRRIVAFRDYRIWNDLLRMEAHLNNLDLSQAKIGSNAIVFPSKRGGEMKLPLEDGYFNMKDPWGKQASTNVVQLNMPFEEYRVWHLGIVLAAHKLGLDLEQAQVDLKQGRITLKGTNGNSLVLPVDNKARILIDWSVPVDRPDLMVQESFDSLIAHDLKRELDPKADVTNRFAGRLVFIGSVASGNDLTDRGATPLEKHAALTSNNWNVANSLLKQRFLRQSSTGTNLMLILLLGALSARITWKMKPLRAEIAVLGVACLFIVVCFWCFISQRYWLPMVMPLGSLLLTHLSLLSYRVFFEDNERRRVRHIFSKIVSPNVVQELLTSERLALGGARREVTVFFADVRGFTELTDTSHARAEETAKQRKLSPTETEALIDATAQDVLQTVNLYLGAIADVIKKHDGTLDKYIGDCVMAFWGAPTPNEHHAVSAVRAAVEAQRAVYSLNQERFTENKRREAENVERAARNEQPLFPLPLLSLGTGVNTGVVTVGLMGSDSHILNFTVFGREVNLASRLESVSGRGRIVIGEATHLALKAHDVTLAATCVELPPVTVKGFRAPVKVYEVPWK